VSGQFNSFGEAPAAAKAESLQQQLKMPFVHP
jgi:hypothetical protein